MGKGESHHPPFSFIQSSGHRNMSEFNKVTFKVPLSSNKNSLKKSIEKLFKVNVVKVNIVNKKTRIKVSRGKKVKKKGYKKAIVTLKKGQNIDLSTGL